jgi:hypothetical protein
MLPTTAFVSRLDTNASVRNLRTTAASDKDVPCPLDVYRLDGRVCTVSLSIDCNLEYGIFE